MHRAAQSSRKVDGRPLHEHNIERRDFRRVAKRAGLPPIRFYDLQDSHLAGQGGPVHIVQRRLGHRSPTTALRYYTHVIPDTERAAADHLADRRLGIRILGIAGDSKMATSGRSGDEAGPAERLVRQGFAHGAGKGIRIPCLGVSICFPGRSGRRQIAGSLDFLGLERERGFEPPTLCLGSRGSLPLRLALPDRPFQGVSLCFHPDLTLDIPPSLPLLSSSLTVLFLTRATGPSQGTSSMPQTAGAPRMGRTSVRSPSIGRCLRPAVGLGRLQTAGAASSAYRAGQKEELARGLHGMVFYSLNSNL